MRPQRCRVASTIAASVASLVTSASKATHSPPDCRAMATVSSAEDSLLSTASTLAPSCAKRRTVARPLPMPSPGDWPAPTTIAILSLRRMESSTAMMPPAAYGNSPTDTSLARGLDQVSLKRRRERTDAGGFHLHAILATIGCKPSPQPEEAHDQPPHLHRAPCRHGRSPQPRVES